MSEERRKILEMVQGGTVTPEQGAALLGLISDSAPPGGDQATPVDPASGGRPGGRPDWVARTRHYWIYGLAAGMLVMLAGGAVVSAAYQQERITLWTWLFGWIPFSLGLATITIAVWARTAPWVHLRILGPSDRVVLGFPVPLRLAALVLSVARPWIPKLRDTAIDEAILVLADGLADDQPIMIEVNEQDKGEHVQIYIG
jgi:hypothetical protein